MLIPLSTPKTIVRCGRAYRRAFAASLATLFWIVATIPLGLAADPRWVDDARIEFPNTDFTRHSVALDEIHSGGPPRDGIPPVDAPVFLPLESVTDIADTEPVVGLILNGDARAYPLRIMLWHEIVNDTVGGIPVTITYCPLCNTAIVFDRRLDGRVLDFGTTGRLRNSDLVMYDRQTESWWQQFLGEAIIGELTGMRLDIFPARLESFASFRSRAPEGRVLSARTGHDRPYGATPYDRYDSRSRPIFPTGPMPSEVAPLSRVVRVGDRAWSLGLLRERRLIEVDDLRITWSPGQNSALDSREIARGFDVGNVVVERRGPDGWTDTAYSVDFAFAFRAFFPDAPIFVD